VKLPESTEWVLHAATSLAQLGPGAAASAAQLAEHYDLPPAYLAKQLQALVRAGVLSAATGPRGGFRLARPAAEITLLQVVEAVDGEAPFYTCKEIRQRGRAATPPEQCREACGLAAQMAVAEAAWRQSLRAVTIADIVASLPDGVPGRTRELLARPR
jgi:Rrf2 family protein